MPKIKTLAWAALAGLVAVGVIQMLPPDNFLRRFVNGGGFGL